MGMNQHFVGGPTYDSYIVSFTETLSEEEAYTIIEECGALLANFMKTLSMAVVYVSSDEKEIILKKLGEHPKIKTAHANRAEQKPRPLTQQ